jgi:hypothetical protein
MRKRVGQTVGLPSFLFSANITGGADRNGHDGVHGLQPILNQFIKKRGRIILGAFSYFSFNYFVMFLLFRKFAVNIELQTTNETHRSFAQKS